MSWQDNIKQPFTITTGDGVTYTPQWNPTQSVVLVQDFNTVQFEFKGIVGTLVDRAEVKGNMYHIEVVFTGADHLVQAKNFRDSAADARASTIGKLKAPWTINHPYYGILVVQPVSLKYNNEEGNVSKITGTVIETIQAENLTTGIDPYDKISVDKVTTDAALFDAYVAAVPTPQTIDTEGMLDNIETASDKVSPLVSLSDDFNAFKNAVNTALYYANGAASSVGKAMAAAQSMLSYPALFTDTVINRLAMLKATFDGLYDEAVDITEGLKSLYENNAGTVISSMCLATVTNVTDDYDNNTDVLSVINTILAVYNQHLLNLDSLQSDNGSEPGNYIPDFTSLDALTSLVNYTINSLYAIAVNAKQQNIYILPENDDVYNLSYRLYGTVADDTVDQFIADNDIEYPEILMLKKGREVVYYT